MTKAGITLSHEDRILWGRVVASAAPLKGRAAPAVAPEPEQSPAPEEMPVQMAPAQPNAPPRPSPQVIDRPTRQKLARGRLAIEARVDLHGLTQSEAYSLLLSFLSRAQAAGLRHVLVITGKGSVGDGVLRRAAPVWFATPPFRPIVGGYEPAARQHGGEGAFYVKLRRSAARA